MVTPATARNSPTELVHVDGLRRIGQFSVQAVDFPEPCLEMVPQLADGCLDLGSIAREHQLVAFDDGRYRYGRLQQGEESFGRDRATESSFPVAGKGGAYLPNGETFIGTGTGPK